VIGRIGTLFAEHGVSVEAVQQSVNTDDADGHSEHAPGATLVIGTHQATEAALAATVAALADTPVVARVESVLRVEGQ
jgi:homoserine dehydrogenase